MQQPVETPTKQFLGHPVGLYVLFFTEMWERFSYYGMRAILVLYLVAETSGSNPGLGWDDQSAYALYGWYTMFVYVASVPGGFVADRILGQKRTVMLGGALLCAGHGILAIEQPWAFYTGLILVVLGVGGLKPNISTMVGGLYPDGDPRRDMGFYIFYMGINLGAFGAALLVGWVGEAMGWHWGFGLAGVGMVLGQIVYMIGQPQLKAVGNAPEPVPLDQRRNLFGDVFRLKSARRPMAAVALVGLGVGLLTGAWGYGMLIVGLSVGVGVFFVFFGESDQKERDRLTVIVVSFLIIVVFWGAFEQAGGLMNVYAKENTDRTLGDFEVPASWFQSINALYILMFAPLVGMFWNWWKRNSHVATSLFKMAVGTIIMGSGFLFMSAAVVEYQAEGSSAMIWLVLAYLLHTIGELCASPVALSFITKLSPRRYGAFMMGAYFAATGLGSKVAGALGELSTDAGEFAVFTGIFIFCAAFGVLMLVIRRPLERLTHGAEENTVES